MSSLEYKVIKGAEDKQLLEQSMKEIFYKTWPEYDPKNSALCETTDNFIDVLSSNNESYKPFLMVAGKDLDTVDKREIIGFRYAVYFPESETAINIYLAVKEDERRKGYGTQMVDITKAGLEGIAKECGKTLKGIFFELDASNKQLDHTNDKAPTNTNSIFFDKLDARKIPINYIQPPWEEGDKQIEKFDLKSLPVNGKHPNAELTGKFLFDLYHTYAEMSEQDIKSNKAFSSMIKQLNAPEPVTRIPDLTHRNIPPTPTLDQIKPK